MTEPYKTTYEKGKMIITHPSGHIDIYGVDHLLDQRAEIEKDIVMSQEDLTDCDKRIKQIIATIPKQPLLKRLRNLVTRKE